MIDKEITNEMIVKALECCIESTSRNDCEDLECPACEECGCYFMNRSTEDYPESLIQEIGKDALDLIKRINEEKERLESVLMAVMHSVDKWLEGDELKQDEANRACTMREKTLQIVEKQQAEIESLKDALKDLKREMSYMSSPNTIGDRHEMGCW